MGPALGVLQAIVASIFSDFEDFTVYIFDNLLIGCDFYDDGYMKLEKILDRCIERNIILKFTKSFFGHDTAHFLVT